MGTYRLGGWFSMTIDGRAINSSSVGVTTPDEGHFTTLRGQRYQISVKTADYTVTTADLGGILLMNSGSETTFTLPVVGSSDDGSGVVLGRIGSGKLNITPDTGDAIMDSTVSSGTIYNNQSGTSTCIELVYVDTVQTWITKTGVGTWITL